MATNNIRSESIYLFTGYVEGTDFVGDLTPVMDTYLYCLPPADATKAGVASLLQSDENALLQILNYQDIRIKKPYKMMVNLVDPTLSAKVPVNFPPTEAVMFLALAKMDGQKDGPASWGEAFVEAMKGFINADKPQAELHPLLIKLDKIKAPTKDEKGKTDEQVDADKKYKAWYDKLAKHPDIQRGIPALVLPKVRGLFLSTTIEEFKDKVQTVTLKRKGQANSEKLGADRFKPSKNEELFIATHIGTGLDLPQAMYEITVTFKNAPGSKKLWSGNTLEEAAGGKNSYSLSAMLRFDYSVPGGEFGMVNIDPVSVEETLIQQFPNQYPHLIQAALDYNDNPNITTVTGKKDKNDKPVVGMDALVKNIAMTKSWGDMANNIGGLSGKSPAMWLLGQAAHDDLSTHEHPALKHILDGTFSAQSIAVEFMGGKWKDQATEFRKATVQARYFLSRSNKTALVQRQLSNGIKGFFTDFKIEGYNTSLAGYMGISEKFMSILGKSMVVAGLASSTVAVAQSGMALARKSSDSSEANEDYTKVIDSYLKATGFTKLEQIKLQVQFKLDSAKLTSDKGIAQLEAIAEKLKTHKDETLKIEGHTCILGGKEYNYRLSKDRAAAVKKKLVDLGVRPASRITTIGQGPDTPIGSNETDAGRILNRRVMGTFTVPSELGFPCREGMQSCERLRMKSVGAKIAQYDATVKLAESTFDLILGIAALFPITSFAAFAIGITKAAGTSASEFYKAYDHAFLDHALKDERFIQKICHDSAANQILMRGLTEDPKEWWGSVVPDKNLPALQYRLRSEAITGLLNLLIRAQASAADPDNKVDLKKLKTADAQPKTLLQYMLFDKYHVDVYIQNFILNDQWVFPLRTFGTLTMDEMWLFTVNDYNHSFSDGNGNLEKDIRLSNGLGVDAAWELVKDVAAYSLLMTPMVMHDIGEFMLSENSGREALLDCSQMMSVVNPYMPGDVKADFQKYFPIHQLATPDIELLAKTFEVSWPKLDQNIYERTAMFVRESSQQPWKLLSAEMHANQGTCFTPYTQFKITVIFKKDKINSMLPVNFQLFRVDGLLDTKGIKYKKIAKLIRRDDFDGLPGFEEVKSGKYDGYYGCEVTPFYRFGDLTILGLKPMMTPLWQRLFAHDTVDEYYQAGNFNEMEYEFKIQVGKNKDTDLKLPIIDKSYGSKCDTSDDKTRIPLDLIKSRQGEAKFLIKEFLLSNSVADILDKVFVDKKLWFLDEKDLGVVPFIRIGGDSNPWITPNPMFNEEISKYPDISLKDDNLYIDNFDWNSQVEFAFVVTAKEINTQPFLLKHRSYYKTKASCTMYEDRPLQDLMDSKKEGPDFNNLNFEYIGRSHLKGNIRSSFVSREPLHDVPSYKPEKAKDSDNNTYILKNDDLLATQAPKHSDAENLKQLIDMLEAMQGFSGLTGTKWEQLKLISKVVKTGDKTLVNDKHFAQAKANSVIIGGGHYYYLAYQNLSYTNQYGEKIKGIKPFGDSKIKNDAAGSPGDKYYRYVFENFMTAAGRKIEPKGRGKKKGFYFSSPASFFDDKMPWKRKPKDPSKSALKASELNKPFTFKEAHEWTDKKAKDLDSVKIEAIKGYKEEDPKNSTDIDAKQLELPANEDAGVIKEDIIIPKYLSGG